MNKDTLNTIGWVLILLSIILVVAVVLIAEKSGPNWLGYFCLYTFPIALVIGIILIFLSLDYQKMINPFLSNHLEYYG